MNPSATTTTDLHQQAQLLLPWYLNQSLRPEQHQQVESHIRQCLLCRRELVSLQRLAKAVTELSDLEVAAETSFARLRSKLPARAPTTRPAKTTNVVRLTTFSRQHVVKFAMVATLVLAIIPLSLQNVHTRTGDNFYTLSAEKAELAHDKQLRVIFAKSLTGTEVTAILATIHGKQLDNPNSVGAFTVTLDSDDSPTLDETIALLRSRSDVLLVEPVMQP